MSGARSFPHKKTVPMVLKPVLYFLEKRLIEPAVLLQFMFAKTVLLVPVKTLPIGACPRQTRSYTVHNYLATFF